MGMADLKLNSEIHHLKARIAELEAALHIATNDKLSLLDQLDQAHQRRMAQIDYGCDLQRIIEDLCRGGPIREPKTSARHHYDMAKERLSAEALSRTGAVKVDRQRLNIEISKWATDSDLNITIGDVEALHLAILSALEPAAPEGQQSVAWRHPLEAYADSYAEMSRMGDGRVDCRSVEADIRQNMIPATRPSEQAVTDEMVDAAQDAWEEADNDTGDLDACWRAAIKAAMEAGRHDSR